jgi:hypothetical protein
LPPDLSAVVKPRTAFAVLSATLFAMIAALIREERDRDRLDLAG